MKLYECIVDDGKNVFKTTVATKNRKELLNVYGGNGDFVKIKDITNEYLTDTTEDKLNDDLIKMGWGENERIMICGLVRQHIENR